MISYEGEFRNGKKYAELAYLLPISGNSGVQKRMALTTPSMKSRPMQTRFVAPLHPSAALASTRWRCHLLLSLLSLLLSFRSLLGGRRNGRTPARRGAYLFRYIRWPPPPAPATSFVCSSLHPFGDSPIETNSGAPFFHLFFFSSLWLCIGDLIPLLSNLHPCWSSLRSSSILNLLIIFLVLMFDVNLVGDLSLQNYHAYFMREEEASKYLCVRRRPPNTYAWGECLQIKYPFLSFGPFLSCTWSDNLYCVSIHQCCLMSDIGVLYSFPLFRPRGSFKNLKVVSRRGT